MIHYYDQYDLVLYFNDKLDYNTDQYIRIEVDYNNNLDKKDLYDRLKKDNAIRLLNTYELFAFFVDIEKITDTKIIEYFKDNITEETDYIFKTYTDIAEDKTMFSELRKLLDSFSRK
jgi:hypothetical protein